MTTNKPEAETYSPITHDGRSALMQEDDFGGWVRVESYEALQAECEKLLERMTHLEKLLSAAADYATKLEPMSAKLLNAIDASLQGGEVLSWPK